MNKKIILVEKIGFPLETESPFIVAIHHLDNFPKGNKNLGPDTSLSGRHIGQDFSNKDGFNMYHGNVVPGFPAHPHRGFETVTVVLEGIVDHFDSSGSKGRYGSGDTQWLTTGKGCQHSEMFPLVNEDKDNKLELFQIWLNLPAKSKFVEPEYKMLWQNEVPNISIKNKEDKEVKVMLVAGKLNGIDSLAPASNSWAASKENHVGIMQIEMEPNSEFVLPAISKTLNRNLYYYNGTHSIEIDGKKVSPSSRIKCSGNADISITNGDSTSYILLLEGEPINEAMATQGPFVMNTNKELKEAYNDYRKTQFGGWPWPKQAPTNDRNAERFARYSDGKTEFAK